MTIAKISKGLKCPNKGDIKMKMKRYKFKMAKISGCYCYGIKKYLSMTRRSIINGYELTRI